MNRAQRRIARRLQMLGNAGRDIIRAFRGVGKSYISVAYEIEPPSFAFLPIDEVHLRTGARQ